MSILFILIFIFFIWPLIRISWAVHKARKQARQAYEQMFGSQQRPASERKAGWSKPEAQRNKVFDRTMGEYVKFEEVTETVHTEQTDRATQRTTSYTTERQVVDVEWEDIK